jgi:hypothetical protein
MTQFDKLFFDRCMGLGDAFVMNAIIHHYARMCKTLYYPAKGDYFETLKCLYQDYPNIEVWRFYSNEQEDVFLNGNPDVIQLKSLPLVTQVINRKGCIPEQIQVHWQQQLYENWDIPYKMRYLDFHMPDNIDGSDELYDQLTDGEDDYILVHRYASDHPNGIAIDIPAYRETKNLEPKKIIEVLPGQAENMLQYKKLIENAAEIHCVASSFFNLVDSMVTKVNGVLIFHDIRRNSLMKVNSRWNDWKWQIVDYPIRL